MKRVFGRGDHFSGRAAFNMDVWLDRRGRLLARFWSRSEEVDNRSLELLGANIDQIPQLPDGEGFTDLHHQL